VARIVVTPGALRDLERLRQFLQTRNPPAARRAAMVIWQALQTLAVAPEANRPDPQLPQHRELVIKFGASGYIARYHYLPGGEVTVLCVKHQREGDYSGQPST